MSEISSSTIAVNRYAPEGSSAIELYNYNGAEGLTISQLIIAVQVRRCACLERDSVVQSNLLNRGVEHIDTLSAHAETVLQALSTTEESEYGDKSELTKASKAAKAKWKSEIRAYLLARGLTEDELPVDIETYERRMQAMEMIQNRLTAANSSIDRTAIELETCINRRDTMYRIATECVTHGGASSMNMAANYANT